MTETKVVRTCRLKNGSVQVKALRRSNRGRGAETVSGKGAGGGRGGEGHPSPPPALFALKVLLLIALYFPCSIGLTFYQKWFIKGFRFPLSVVCVHYIVKFLAAALMRAVYSWWTKKERVALGWEDCVWRVAPIGVAASIDIGLSNWAFEFITVSLYTMGKSTSTVFIIIFAVILSLEELNWSLPVVMTSLSLGLFLFTFHSTQFDWTGFILVELASVCCGIRWAMSQFLMQRKEMGLRSPVDMIYYVQPWMILGILPLAFAFEGDSLSQSTKGFEFVHLDVPLRYLGLTVIGGLIALAMELSEYMLLVNTSSLTVSVVGIFKEMLTLFLAHRYNQDRFSTLNTLGLFLLIGGISLHVYSKWKKAKKDEIAARKPRMILDEEESLMNDQD